MTLHRIGATTVPPLTTFYWDPDSHATVELTQLGEDHVLVRATKSYRLLKQDAEGQETWDRNLRQLNDYLAARFPSFRISVDYVNEVAPDATPTRADAEALQAQAGPLLAKRQRLTRDATQLEESIEFGLETFTDALQHQLTQVHDELATTDQQLARIIEELQRKKRELGEWRKNGVMVAFLFTIATDPELAPQGAVDDVVQNHLGVIVNHHRRKVKQVLQGSQFKLVVEEAETPRVLNRLEHTTLLNPTRFDQLRAASPHLEEELDHLKAEAVSAYAAFALEDLEVDGTVVEESKVTPAQAVNALLQGLDTAGIASMQDVPLDGLIVGTIAKTDLPVGFDLTTQPHYYINGATGSGKTHLKRVLIENCASAGYSVISLSPEDRQALGAALPNPAHEQGRGLAANQYWLGDDRLLALPADLADLATGVHFVTMAGTSNADKQEFVARLFETLAEVGTLDVPLFVFLDEAHLFAEGAPADAIQRAVRQTRKHGIHVVLVTQSPMDFNYTYKHIRENTTGNFFLQGEYYDYAEKYLADETEIRTLPVGRALFFGRGQPRLDIDVRETLTSVTEPSDDEVATLAERWTGEQPPSRRPRRLRPRTTSSKASQPSRPMKPKWSRQFERSSPPRMPGPRSIA